MKQLEADRPTLDSQPHDETELHEGRHRGHSRWMMVACCVPMLLIAGIAVLAGAGLGFLLIAVMCTVMMVAMMGAMSGRSGGEGGGR